MRDIILLAIVEVDKINRVLCRAPECKHSIYKRIHIIKVDGKITVYGSECFKQLLGNEADIKPQYGSSTGRLLTSDERLLLLENTERLIAQFDGETQVEVTKTEFFLPEKSKQLESEQVGDGIPIQKATLFPTANANDKQVQQLLVREVWIRDRLLPNSPSPSSPQIWENWKTKDWEKWAKQRLAGKAAWIDTHEAMTAWRKLTYIVFK